MDATNKKVEHHLKKALETIRPSKARSRSGSPVRAERKERKKREPKEKPAKIHVCREPASGKYKKCSTPKKK